MRLFVSKITQKVVDGSEPIDITIRFWTLNVGSYYVTTFGTIIFGEGCQELDCQTSPMELRRDHRVDIALPVSKMCALTSDFLVNFKTLTNAELHIDLPLSSTHLQSCSLKGSQTKY